MGAAPQLTYRLFLETLAARGILVSLVCKLYSVNRLVSLQLRWLGFRSLPVRHVGSMQSDTASARPR